MMKKNDDRKLNRDTNELDALNSSLGSFGLEPPKHYRNEENKNADGKRKPQNKKQQKKKSSQQNISNNDKLKKHKKKRRLKKKFRILFTVIGLVIGISIVVAILCLTVGFKIQTIQINPCEMYTEEQISAVLPIEKEDNLFLIDKKNVAEKLETNLPYIYDVKIKRKIPSTVIVSVTQPEFVYYVINNDDTYTYFDNNFKVLKLNAETKPEANAIEIKKIALSDCTEGYAANLTDSNSLDTIKEMMQLVDELKLTEITSIYSEGTSENYFVYEDRITIKIGSMKDAEDKMYSALASIDKLNTSNPEANGLLTSTGGKQVYFTEGK